MPAKRIASAIVTPQNPTAYISKAGLGVSGSAVVSNMTDGQICFSVIISNAAQPAASETIGPNIVIGPVETTEIGPLAFGDGQILQIVPGHAQLVVNLMGYED